MKLPFMFVATVLMMARVQAADFTIGWSKIAGGGGAGSGGPFSLSGTMAQVDAGQMSGGSFSLTGGFWSAFAAVPMPGAPMLSIRPEGNAARVSWPAPATGFILERSTSVIGNWTAVSSSYATNASEISVIVPALSQLQFFRLRHP